MEGVPLFNYLVIALAIAAAITFVVAWQRDLKDLHRHRLHDCGQDGQRVCTYSTPRLDIGCCKIHQS